MAAYMDNGILDILNVQYRLENGFRVKGKNLVPLAFIYRVDEPDFGCEGRPVGKVMYDISLLAGGKGRRR